METRDILKNLREKNNSLTFDFVRLSHNFFIEL